MAGYSGTALPKKLGIKPGQRIAIRRAPQYFLGLIEPLPEGTAVGAARAPLDMAILFTSTEAELRAEFAPLAAKLAPAGMLWVAWPKRASGVTTDLTGERVRAVGLEAGLVDVKVCAIDDVWSGLKFVIRVEDRPRRR